MLKSNFIKTKNDTSTGFLPCVSKTELRANALNINNAIILSFINNSFQVYRWDSLSTTPDDDTDVIAVTGLTTGRWLKCPLGDVGQASTSNVGITRYATLNETTNGDPVEAAVKPYDLKQVLLSYVTTNSFAQVLSNYANINQLFGVGKRYYDVIASRSLNTYYPNPSTTSPMFVSVCLITPSGSTGTTKATITNSYGESMIVFGSNAAAATRSGCIFIVPPGGSYVISCTAVGTPTKDVWTEER